MADADFVLGEVPRIMDESYKSWYKDSRSLLKYPHIIVEFIDSCGFTCDDLHRIMVWIEWIKWSDYEDTRTDDFDTYNAQRDAELE